MIARRLTGSQKAHVEEARLEADRLRRRARAIEVAARDAVVDEHVAASPELEGSSVRVSSGPDGLPDVLHFEKPDAVPCEERQESEK